MHKRSFRVPIPKIIPAVIALFFVFSANAQTDLKEASSPEQKILRNIISVAPYQKTELPGVSFGIQYEHFLDKNVSLYLPVAFCFLKDKDNPHLTGQYAYAYPGVKFYPWSSQHLFSYSFGPSLALGYGDEFHYPNNEREPTWVSRSEGVQLGVMINNGLNIRPGRFYFGAELGFGMSFCNATTPVFGNSGLLLQFQFKAGYCF
jgi:hypothetical protein